MYALYLIGMLPILVGIVLLALGKGESWQNWLITSVIGLVTAGTFQIALYYGMAGDSQVYSGQVTGTKHFAAWTEYYEEAVYRTVTSRDSKGNTTSREVFDHWEPETRYHPDTYTDYSNIKREYDVDEGTYNWTRDKFGGAHPVPGDRTTMEHDSHMISGDPNDYEAPNQTGYNIPVTDVRTWYNKVKCCPSVFSYAPPPKKVMVYPYPYPTNPFQSNRLLGTAANVNLLLFDQMCARMGPLKKVNLIIVGFGDKDSSYSHYQEAAWVGGKKNDLVLCYGGDSAAPSWTYCFGWTESALVKRNLETLALTQGVTTATLPALETEIMTNYKLKDWHKFDYLTVEPPMWSYFAMFFAMLAGQAVFWVIRMRMDDSPSSYGGYSRSSYRY